MIHLLRLFLLVLCLGNATWGVMVFAAGFSKDADHAKIDKDTNKLIALTVLILLLYCIAYPEDLARLLGRA